MARGEQRLFGFGNHQNHFEKTGGTHPIRTGRQRGLSY